MADISKITLGGNEYDIKDTQAREALTGIEIPGVLPNPNKLTFTGAVEAEYDGSTAVSVEIPAGGAGSEADLSLGITGAAAGQIAKISAVDGDGRPTAWEAVDMPSGGDGGGATTTHSVTWALNNVTSSNNVASVSDGASLIAVLTPADGYTLGDVSVTMEGMPQTDVWVADTSTLTIPSVTGDVVVSCSGVEDNSGEQVDTSPVIAEYDKGLSATVGTINSFPGICYTKIYTFTPDADAIRASSYYDAANDYSTYAGAFGAVVCSTPNAKLSASDYSLTGLTVKASKVWLYRDGEPVSSSSNSSLTSGTETAYTINFPRYSTDALWANGIAFSLSMLDLEDSYVYWGKTQSGVLPVGVRQGDIIFAGKNTPYYGMANIDGTLLVQAAQSVDQDISMDYAVATTSVLGETPANDTQTAYGVSEDVATLITEVKNAWMTEYGGDYRKIPLIITTDQHGRTNAGIFKLLGSTLSMYDVSKICNLGDTVSVEWEDEDTDHPLLSCAALEKWCESVKDIPYSKQLNVFGNHDTWYANYEDEGNPIGTRYPSSQAHLNQYFRNIYARRINNNGWFTVKDEQFNVKYVVISGFEYKSGVAFRISTAQMDWIIKELSIDDGYDIVIVSHVPLYYQDTTNYWPTDMESSTPDSTTIMRPAGIDTDTLFNARKSKSIGTVTDSDGVEHEFDFSGCSSNILCGLHGHTHIDAYNYVGGDGLMDATFDWFADNTLHFILVDRVSEQVNVWKVEGTALKTTNYQIPLDKPSE